MSYKIFRNGENGHKNSQNVETYDGNFMGHIRTDCCDGIPLSVENFNMEHGNKILQKKMFDVLRTSTIKCLGCES